MANTTPRCGGCQTLAFCAHNYGAQPTDPACQAFTQTHRKATGDTKPWSLQPSTARSSSMR